jgi:hypothetical protein
MKLSKLIEHVGDDNVVLQNILHSSAEITTGKKDGRIAFYTDNGKARDLINQIGRNEKGKWTALVVWLPTERLPDVKEQNTEAQPVATP